MGGTPHKSAKEEVGTLNAFNHKRVSTSCLQWLDTLEANNSTNNNTKKSQWHKGENVFSSTSGSFDPTSTGYVIAPSYLVLIGWEWVLHLRPESARERLTGQKRNPVNQMSAWVQDWPALIIRTPRPGNQIDHAVVANGFCYVFSPSLALATYSVGLTFPVT